MFDGKAVIYRVIGHNIVLRIVDFLVNDRLESRILSRMNLQAPGVEKVIGLILCISFFLLQGSHDLGNQLVRKIGERILAFLCHKIHILNTGIHVVGQSLFLLLLGDLFLLVHILQNDPPLFLIPLATLFRKRIKTGRVLGNAGDDGRFRERQLRDVLVKIAFGCGLDAKRIISQIFRSRLSPRVGSFPPEKTLFLISCWVIVLPPPALESPVTRPTAALMMERMSMPLWLQKRASSIAINASIRHCGSSSYVASSRLAPDLTNISVRFPWLSYTIVA